MCSCAIKKLDEKIYDLVLFIMFDKVSENSEIFFKVFRVSKSYKIL